VGPRGNALFVHTTEAGDLTGFEIKGQGFTGFATGGTKSAWQSAAWPADRALVVTESAIDALSYFQLHPDPADRTRFLSTGGAPSTRQVEILERIFAQLASASRIVAAVDSDDAGVKLASRIEDLARRHEGITFQRHSSWPAKDWNDVLRQVERDYILALPPLGRSLEGGRWWATAREVRVPTADAPKRSSVRRSSCDRRQRAQSAGSICLAGR
jgi:hypothetical protein